MSADRPRILFLCTGNSCRSQMAEGWARALLGDRLDARSAGVRDPRPEPPRRAGDGRGGRGHRRPSLQAGGRPGGRALRPGGHRLRPRPRGLSRVPGCRARWCTAASTIRRSWRATPPPTRRPWLPTAACATRSAASWRPCPPCSTCRRRRRDRTPPDQSLRTVPDRLGRPVHRRGHGAGQAGPPGGPDPGRDDPGRERRAGGVHPHRRLPLLHDVPDHGEDRLRRGGARRQERQARAADPGHQLAGQALHHGGHRRVLPGRRVPGTDRTRRGGPGQAAPGPGPAGGGGARRGHGGAGATA